MTLVTGAEGQLGSDVVLELIRRGKQVLPVDISVLDITDKDAVQNFIYSKKPSYVIHCAAYTTVDAAENNIELCMRTNAEATENIARLCRDINAEMMYISTDYVFDGESDLPYEINATTSPLSVYGLSKLKGEEAVLQYSERHYIVRISWVFGNNGNNFVKTILRLAETKPNIRVVNDQIGSPTYTVDLAVLLCDMISSKKYGIYHATNEGFCSWAEFAEEIIRVAEKNCGIAKIPSEEYPTKAKRPMNSRLSKSSLDKSGFSRLPPWHDAIKRFVECDRKSRRNNNSTTAQRQ